VPVGLGVAKGVVSQKRKALIGHLRISTRDFGSEILRLEAPPSPRGTPYGDVFLGQSAGSLSWIEHQSERACERPEARSPKAAEVRSTEPRADQRGGERSEPEAGGRTPSDDS